MNLCTRGDDDDDHDGLLGKICERCGGEGAIEFGDDVEEDLTECPHCEGTGFEPETLPNLQLVRETDAAAPCGAVPCKIYHAGEGPKADVTFEFDPSLIPPAHVVDEEEFAAAVMKATRAIERAGDVDGTPVSSTHRRRGVYDELFEPRERPVWHFVLLVALKLAIGIAILLWLST